jgi:hypothetical protein
MNKKVLALCLLIGSQGYCGTNVDQSAQANALEIIESSIFFQQKQQLDSFWNTLYSQNQIVKNLTTEQKDLLNELSKKQKDHFLTWQEEQKLELTQIYVENISAEHLQELAAFYRSDLGKKVLLTAEEFFAKLMNVLHADMLDFAHKLECDLQHNDFSCKEHSISSDLIDPIEARIALIFDATIGREINEALLESFGDALEKAPLQARELFPLIKNKTTSNLQEFLIKNIKKITSVYRAIFSDDEIEALAPFYTSEAMNEMRSNLSPLLKQHLIFMQNEIIKMAVEINEMLQAFQCQNAKMFNSSESVE